MNDRFNLTNKTAVVTGGSSGIGESIANVLSERGAYVYLLDIDDEKGHAVQEAIKSKGGLAQYINCNVADRLSVKNAFEAIAGEEQLDILVNNAGIAHVGTVENTNQADFDRVISVNIAGVYHCLQEAIPLMKSKGGSIINLSSVAAHVGLPDRFAYTMSKGAVHGMTLSVAKDYLSYNIRCNSIAPARVHTPFVDGFIAKNYPGNEQNMFDQLSKTQPIGRMGKPEEIAFAVLFLSSDEASFITGTCFPIDGGFITLNN